MYDDGHYNCRDYTFNPHDPSLRPPPPLRHESFDELEARCRSPASDRPKFALLQLPLELRQQILAYCLPYTREYKDNTFFQNHVRNFSAVRKREAKGMKLPTATTRTEASAIVWQRGTTTLLAVCKQLHRECAEMLYGTNTFLLFVTYQDVKFRFRWLLPSGLAPNRNIDILKEFPRRYLQFLKRAIINVDNVDPYTGMIKYNIQGRGLAIGLKSNVQALVDVLKDHERDDVPEELFVGGTRILAKLSVRVSNSNGIVDALKSDAVRQQSAGKINKDVEDMLQPLEELRGVREVNIRGAVSVEVVERLGVKMRSARTAEEAEARLMREKIAPLPIHPSLPPMCVYGNDME